MNAPYTYTPDGTLYAAGDGPELLVYSGTNDGPIWKQFCDGVLVGVAATRDRLFTVDSDGRFTTWNVFDGQKQEELELPGRAPHGLLSTPAGTCAVLASDAAILVDPTAGERIAMTVPGLTTASFGPDANSLGLGDRKGMFHAFDTTTGKPWGSVSVGASVTGVGWRHPALWAVAAGTKVHLVSGDGATIQASIDAGGPTGRIAVSSDGAIVACVVNGQEIAILETGKNTRVGVIRYSRPIHGLAFGPGTWLGIGLEDGDCNRVDLISGKLCRNEPHPGRTANRWGFKVEVDPTVMRSVVTSVRAGGQPIATFIAREDDEGDGGCMKACLTVLVLIFVCMGCAGLSALGYFLFLRIYAPY
jgi:hypothetical protein